MKTLTFDEYLTEEIPITSINEHGAYPPLYKISVINEKKFALDIYVVNNGEGYIYGYHYDYDNGGGGAYPSKMDIPANDKLNGIVAMLDDLTKQASLQKYYQYLDKAKKKLMVKQLTIFDL